MSAFITNPFISNPFTKNPFENPYEDEEIPDPTPITDENIENITDENDEAITE